MRSGWLAHTCVLLLAGCVTAEAPTGACDSSSACPSGEVCIDLTCSRLCESRADCKADHRCDAGRCLPLAGTGRFCAAAADCLVDHVCIERTCKKILGQPCADNLECEHTCIDGECAAISGLHGACDDTGDCASRHTCAMNECLLVDDEVCAANGDCQNVCVNSLCASHSDYGEPCDDFNDCRDPSATCATTCVPFCPGESCDGVDDSCDGSVDEGCEGVCGTAASLNDDFEDASVGTMWTTAVTGDASLAEAGGAASFTPGPSGGHAELRSTRTFDLRNDSFTVAITSVVASDANVEQYFGIEASDGTRLLILQSGGSMRAVTRTSAGTTPLASITFDPATHLFWRLGASEASVSFELSPDNVTFTSFHSTTTAAGLEAVFVVLGAGTTAAVASPGVGAFNDLNGGGGAYGQGMAFNCSATSLADDFGDARLSSRFVRTVDGNGNIVESGGEARTTPPSSTAGVAFIESADELDLTDAGVTVAVANVPLSDKLEALFFAASGVQQVGFSAAGAAGGGSLLTFFFDTGGGRQSVASMPYNGTTQRYWRLRERAGTIYFETSAGDGVYRTAASVANPFTPSAIVLTMGARSAEGGVTLTTVRFDDLNLPP